MRWLIRDLALAHFAWGGSLLLVATYILYCSLAVVPYMSSGATGANLLGALFWAAIRATPVGLLALWMINLGCRAWTLHPRLRSAILFSHGLLLLVGMLAITLGVSSVRAAELSSAHGGGLLGGLAYLPLVFGVPVVILAFYSLATALMILPEYRSCADPLKDRLSCSTAERSRRAWMVYDVLLVLATVILLLWAVWPATHHQDFFRHPKPEASQGER
jgi:hypothetical protein